MWIFQFIRGKEEAGPTFWFAVMVIYISMYMFLPQLVEVLSTNKYGRLLLGVLSILFVIAIPMFIAGLFGKGPASAHSEWGGIFGRGKKGDDSETPEKAAKEKKEAKKTKKQVEEEKKENERMKALEKLSQKLEDINQSLLVIEHNELSQAKSHIEEIEGLLDELYIVDSEINKLSRPATP